ncbi:MAG TPA: hypothetical protein VIV63_03270 [Steroidobacteraceae bacterium]
MSGRPPFRSQHPAHVEEFWLLITIAPISAAIGLAFYGANSGRLWLVAVAAAFGVAGTLIAWKSYERATTRKLERDRARADEIRQQDFGAGESFVVARRRSFVRAIIATGVLVVAIISLSVLDLPAWKWAALGLLVPPTAIGWFLALRERGDILELSSSGIRAAGHEVLWSDVANILHGYEWRDQGPYLRVLLNQPLPPQTLSRRIRSMLSRGESDREIFVLLTRASESPAVIYDVALEVWGRMGGPAIRPAAQKIEAPRRPSFVVVAAALTIGVLFIHGLSVDFLTSTAWSAWTGWVAAAVTILTLWWLHSCAGFPGILLSQRSTASYLMTLLVMVPLMLLGSWAITARSLPDTATRWFGAQTQQVVLLHKVSRKSSRGCRLRITGELFFGRTPPHYCVSGEEYERLPDRGPMKLTTTESWFGMHIHRIEPAEAATPE